MCRYVRYVRIPLQKCGESNRKEHELFINDKNRKLVGTSKHMQDWPWGFDYMQTCDIDKHSR